MSTESVDNYETERRREEKTAAMVSDTSLIPYPLNHTALSPLEAGLKISCTVVLMFVAIVGNVSVIVTVARNRRMRTATNCYIVNLAVSDLMVSLSCTWVNLVEDLTDDWALGSFFCVFNSFAQVLSLVSSILTLTAIACDRFFGIVFAIKSHLANRRPSAFIFVVWLASVATSSPLLFYRKQMTRKWLDHVEVWCEDEWPNSAWVDPDTNLSYSYSPYRKFYYTLVCLVLFFVPVVVMTAVYVIIIVKLWSHRVPGDASRDVSERSIQVALKMKVIKMLLVVLFVFVFCWLPFQISILYAEHRSSTNDQLPWWYLKLNYYANVLAYSNSSINPIIYTCFNTNFRQGFKETLHLRRSSVNFVESRASRNIRSHVTMAEPATAAEQQL